MKKRVLMIATVPSMIGQFNMNNIKILQKMGYAVDVAGDFTDTSVWPIERIHSFKNELAQMNIRCIQLDFSRSPLMVNRHIASYNEVLKLLKKQKYSFLHTHTPIASAIVRMAACKTGTKVIYTAHGFHFFKGAPLKNWLIFYPVEWFCSWLTDVLITINKEDYMRAKKYFHARKVAYIPGVGLDISKFRNIVIDEARKRKELGVPDDAFVLLSVGELNENKNQQVIIKAIAKLNCDNIHYLIAGKGNTEEHLRDLSIELGISDQVHLLGFRNDVPELNAIADAFCFPSRREGLGLAALEAMACGLPIITSNIHGINDYSINGVTGYKCDRDDVDGFANAIKMLIKEKENGEFCKYRKYNLKAVKKYDLNNSQRIMHRIYENLGE